MAITKSDPRTVHLGGEGVIVNTLAAGVAIVPGYLIERYVDSGVDKVRPHSTAAGAAAPIFALNPSMLNADIDTAYAIGDLVEAIVASPGCTIWALIASGQTIVTGDFIESVGDGFVRKYNAGVKIATAIESKTATATTRLRIEVL